MPNVRLTDLAEVDLLAAWHFLDERNPGAAEQFVAHVLEVLSVLTDFPLAGNDCSHIRPGYRRFVVDRYTLYYLVLDGDVEIHRILHNARDVEGSFEPE